jgi:putative transposase
MKRIQINVEDAYYHCSNTTAFQATCLNEDARSVFVSILNKVAGFCGVSVVTYCVMENHFHLLIKVPKQQLRENVTDSDLVRRFRLLYGDENTRYMPITANDLEKLLNDGGELGEQWRKLLKSRMHDLPMFMKLLKQRFSKWYNATYRTKGTLWSERYSSILLEPSAKIIGQVACFIDLHAVSEGLVEHPEDYVFCGFSRIFRGDYAHAEALIDGLKLKRGVMSKVLMRYEALLYNFVDIKPKSSRKKVLAEFLESERKTLHNAWMGAFDDSRIDLVLVLLNGIIYGSYVFVEANAQWIAKHLGRKLPGRCSHLSEDVWTLNRRLKQH